jgi:hypothetical protein
LRRLGLNAAEKLYCFLKALLPIPKRRIPAPSRSKVTGQGKGQPKNGLGMPANINIHIKGDVRAEIAQLARCTLLFQLLITLNLHLQQMESLTKITRRKAISARTLPLHKAPVAAK